MPTRAFLWVGRAFVAWWAGLVAIGCQPDLGVKKTPALSGTVVDAETGAPLAGVEVFATYRYVHWIEGTTPRTTLWATTDGSGRFSMPERTLSLDQILFRLAGPSLNFFHPWYGMESEIPSREPGEAAEPEKKYVLRARSRFAENGWAHLCEQCETYDTLAPSGCHRFREVACRDGAPLRAAEESPWARAEREATETLRAFLAIPPEALVAAAVAEGDLRFLISPEPFAQVQGVRGREVRDPHIDTRPIPGFVAEQLSPEYEALKRRARRHAQQFNQLLLPHRHAANR